MAEYDRSGEQGERQRSNVSNELGSWVVPRTLDPSYYDALHSVEGLQGYVQSDEFIEDITRGLEITRQLNEEERNSRNTD